MNAPLADLDVDVFDWLVVEVGFSLKPVQAHTIQLQLVKVNYFRLCLSLFTQQSAFIVYILHYYNWLHAWFSPHLQNSSHSPVYQHTAGHSSSFYTQKQILPANTDT